MKTLVRMSSWMMIALMALVVFQSCNKDEDEDEVIVVDLQNLTYSETGGFVDVNWQFNTDAVCYMIFVDDVAVQEEPITNSYDNIGKLEDGCIIKVEAYKEMEMETVVARASIKYEKQTVFIQPNPVTNLTVVEEGDGFVKLSWENPTNDYDFIVVYNGPRVEGNFDNQMDSPINGSTEKTYSDLTNGQTYDFYFYARAVDNAGTDKEYSEPVMVSATPEADNGGGGLQELFYSVWEYEDSWSSDMNMKLSFTDENSVIFNDIDGNHYLTYTWDPETYTGEIIDANGYYSDSFTVNADATVLNAYGEDFQRGMK